MTPEPISCEVCFSLMEEYRRNLLTPGEKEKFLIHIEKCAPCAEDLRLAENLGFIISSNNEVGGQAPDFATIRQRAKEEFKAEKPDNPPLTEDEKKIIHSENRFSSRHIGMAAAAVILAAGWFLYEKFQILDRPQIDNKIVHFSGPALSSIKEPTEKKITEPSPISQETVLSDMPASEISESVKSAPALELNRAAQAPSPAAPEIGEAPTMNYKMPDSAASFSSLAPTPMSSARSLRSDSATMNGILDQSVSTTPLTESFRKEILRKAEEHRSQNENAAAMELYKTARGENKDRIAAAALLALAKLTLETSPELARNYLEKLKDSDLDSHLTAEERTERDKLLQSLPQ